MKLPILLESDGKLLIDWTADGICVLYPKLFRDGHDWYAFIDCVFNHWDVKLKIIGWNKMGKIRLKISQIDRMVNPFRLILLTLDPDSYNDTTDWHTCEQSTSNLDCTVNRTVVCVQPKYDCMCASFDGDDGNCRFQTSPRNAHLFCKWKFKNQIKI